MLGTATEQGLYRLTVEPVAQGLALHLTDAQGRPIEDAAIWPARPDVLVEPGECDSIEEARCFHPGGVYILRTNEALELTIEADPGADRAVIRSPAR